MRWSTKIVNTLQWSGTISNRDEKEAVGKRLAEKITDGSVIGVGSGSTSFVALQLIGERARRENLRITAIPTSPEVAMACAALEIPTTTLLQARPDWCFDGADEVDPNNSLIKGRGGAMFMEKLVIASAPKTYILVDRSKMVTALGQKFPVPVEVHPLALNLVETRLAEIGATEITLRPAQGKDGPIVTESGNLILDARFSSIGQDMETRISAIPGVIESGLFIGYNVEVMLPE
jgi:ribose 5-phosphate isomerase A